MNTIKTTGALLAGCLGVAVSGPSAFGQLIGNYTFNDVVASTGGMLDPSPPPAPPGVEFGRFSAVGIGTTPRASQAWSFSGWGTIPELDSGKYFETTLTPLGGALLDLDELQLDVRRSASGPRDFAVRTSLDNFGSNVPGAVNSQAADLQVSSGIFHFANDVGYSSNVEGATVELGSAFAALTQPVSFRIYGFGAEQSGGTFTVDNVSFQGAISLVPEPGEYAMAFGGALVLYGVWRQRRRSTSLR